MNVPPTAFAELAGVYALLDARLAALSVVCRACGACCDFVRNDYRLYASRLERELVIRHHGLPRLSLDGRCRFLHDGRCSIHPHRPLGCRTFFCDPAHKASEQHLYHTALRQIQDIADRHQIPWDYAPFFEPSP